MGRRSNFSPRSVHFRRQSTLLQSTLWKLGTGLLVAAAVALGTQTGAWADAALNVPLVGQQDSRWGGYQMNGGAGPDTIAAAGCAITSVAMVLDYYGIPTNPGAVNYYLGTTGGYANREDIIWAAVDGLSGGQVAFTGWTGPDVNLITSELDQGHPVIAEVSLNGNQHFVVITGYSAAGLQINDPWFADSVLFQSRYGDPATGILSIRTFAPAIPAGLAPPLAKLASTGSAARRAQ